jgi:hypothetical protein
MQVIDSANKTGDVSVSSIAAATAGADRSPSTAFAGAFGVKRIQKQ